MCSAERPAECQTRRTTDNEAAHYALATPDERTEGPNTKFDGTHADAIPGGGGYLWGTTECSGEKGYSHLPD